MDNNTIPNRLKSGDDISTVIKEAFDISLDIEGGWGYNKDDATIINNLGDLTIEHFIQTFATIRANIQLNLTLDDKNRYAGINVNMKDKKSIKENDTEYIVTTFEISAIKESLYAMFIDEYKDGYGKDDFDIEDHFKRRKENTLIFYDDLWVINRS